MSTPLGALFRILSVLPRTVLVPTVANPILPELSAILPGVGVGVAIGGVAVGVGV
jgi:hypothetical protein